MSTWSVVERARTRRSEEHLLFPKKQAAGLRACLVYPNAYRLAMGNLGFQTVYGIFDKHPGVVCERAFLPDEDQRAFVPRGALRTLESNALVRDCDIIAFSLSFEADYWHVVRLLDLIGIPCGRRERHGCEPLVIAGGPAVFLNPEPLAEFVDLFLIGEAEEMLPEFLEVFARTARRTRVRDHGFRAALLEEAATSVAGTYVPEFFEPVYDGERLRAVEHTGPGPATVERRLIWDLDAVEARTQVLSEEAVFGDMVLVEASRGCQWGCRFCAAGYMYRPIRTRSVDGLQASVREALTFRDTVGLVGAEMASVPGVEAAADLASDLGGRVSPSSLKADCITPRLASALARGRNRSATVAPEAGSERMRRVINKNLSESDILRAADLLVGEGVRDLKLYFMVGLPTETTEDVDAIAALTAQVRARLGDVDRSRHRVSRITVSVNPFVPKPWTPFQWEPMQPIPELKRKFAHLRRALSAVGNVRLDADSPREAYFQTLLSRGDRRVAGVLRAISDAGGSWWDVIRQWRRGGMPELPEPDAYVHRSYGEEELLPWDFIDHRISKSFLRVERRKALLTRQTPPCDTTTCVACAAC